MAEIVIIPLQTFSGFATNGNAAMEASTPLIAGKRYRLSWDGVEYLYDAIDFSQIYGPGATAVVDVTADDPFGVVYVPGIDGNPDQYIFGPTMADLDAGIDSHTVGLWLVEEGSGGNDHPDETVILPAGDVAFAPGVNGLGEPIYTTTFLEFELVRWRKYRVRWEGEETVLMAYPGPNGEVCLGNLFITGAGENTGERFLIVYGEGYSNIATYEAGESREVAIWLTNEVGVVLQDYAGGERAYYDVERLAVPSTDGNIREYVHSSLIPEAVEKTLELNFENGPMEVLPELGKVFSKLLIPVPEGLVSENIPKGVKIAGVEGTRSESGASGTFYTEIKTLDKVLTYSSAFSKYVDISVDIPPNATIIKVIHGYGTQTHSVNSVSEAQLRTLKEITDYTTQIGEDKITVTASTLVYKQARYYGAYYICLIVVYVV